MKAVSPRFSPFLAPLVIVSIAMAETCGPTRLELVADVCTPFGEIMMAEVRLGTPSEPILGGQFFIEYSNTNLFLLDFAAGDQPIETVFHFDDTTVGLIEMAVVSFFGITTQEEIVLARLSFQVIHDAGHPFVRFFYPGDERRTLLSGAGGVPVVPLLGDPTSEDVDLHDFADLQNCLGDGPPSDCRCKFDMDGDQDVDADDWEVWAPLLIGPLGGCAG